MAKKYRDVVEFIPVRLIERVVKDGTIKRRRSVSAEDGPPDNATL
jgi:hypothetical protein